MIKVVRSNEVKTYKGPGDGRTKILLDPKSKGANNLSLGWITFPVGGKTDDHMRDVEEIIYVIRGTTTIVSDGERHELSKGDVVFIPPGVVHRHENDGSEPLEQIWIFAPPGPEQRLKDLPTE